LFGAGSRLTRIVEFDEVTNELLIYSSSEFQINQERRNLHPNYIISVQRLVCQKDDSESFDELLQGRVAGQAAAYIEQYNDALHRRRN
jgi:hypothetical protein